MSDGTMAIQVSPVPTEEEMSQVRGLFERAANAIVQASHLGNQVAELTAKVDKLTSEVSRALASNQWLAEQLATVRTERDSAKADAADAHVALSTARNTIDEHINTIQSRDGAIASFRHQIDRLERESDEHLLRAMAAEEELGKVKDKLNDAQAWYEQVKAILDPPVVAQEPEQVSEDQGAAIGRGHDFPSEVELPTSVPTSEEPASPPSMVEQKEPENTEEPSPQYGTSGYRW